MTKIREISTFQHLIPVSKIQRKGEKNYTSYKEEILIIKIVMDLVKKQIFHIFITMNEFTKFSRLFLFPPK